MREIVEDHFNLYKGVWTLVVVSPGYKVDEPQVKCVGAFLGNRVGDKHIKGLLRIQSPGIYEVKHSDLEVLVKLDVCLENLVDPHLKLRFLLLVPVLNMALKQPFL
jgi:pyruvate-formate lyase-activating enzyme